MKYFNSFNQACKLAKEMSDREPYYIAEFPSGNNQVIAEFYLSDLPNGCLIKGKATKGELSFMRQYKTPVGVSTSVTTILKLTESEKSKNRLRKWKHKMAKLFGEGAGEAIALKAAERGTKFHKEVTQYFKNMPVHNPSNFFIGVAPFLHRIKPIKVENFCWSMKGFAGTYDLLCDWNGQLTMWDWKTKSRIQRRQWLDEAFLQCAAYAIAANEGFKRDKSSYKINQLIVAIAREDGCQIFNESLEDIEPLWESRLNLYLEEKL